MVAATASGLYYIFFQVLSQIATMSCHHSLHPKAAEESVTKGKTSEKAKEIYTMGEGKMHSRLRMRS